MAEPLTPEQQRRLQTFREYWPNFSVGKKSRLILIALGAKLRRPFSRIGWVVCAALLWCFGSIVVSACEKDWSWFERSGSILTLAGAVLAGRAIVREGRAGTEPRSSVSIAHVVGSYIDTNGRQMTRFVRSTDEIRQRREERRDSSAMVVGLLLGIAGTIVWGYGVPLSKLVGLPHAMAVHDSGQSTRLDCAQNR